MESDSAVWIEWIPNISTSDPGILARIEATFGSITGLHLLHVDRGKSVNRTVLTVVGTRDALHRAVFELLGILVENVDMSLHRGTHPRLGVLDVSPFVPLDPGDKAVVIRWARETAGQIAEKFRIPVYLYEDSASGLHRRNLADIRRGEYEGLELKIRDPEWIPDFGDSFNPRTGATVTGVRDFLIAYNVNLPDTTPETVRKLAAEIREAGRADRAYSLPGVKAIGWQLEEENLCQVSTNIVNTEVADPLLVYERVKYLAARKGIEVSGSELIGLIPWKVVSRMLAKGFPDSGALTRHLGLEYAGIEDILERVIEYRMYLSSGKELFKDLFDQL